MRHELRVQPYLILGVFLLMLLIGVLGLVLYWLGTKP